MRILAIETSCDDTCVAILKIVNCKLQIETNIISSQVKLHAKYGGVFPTLAKREHQKNLPLVLKKALRLTSLARGKQPKIDYVAVTNGPGLEPCLWTGINFAENLAKKLKTPLLPINHIEAHILANFIKGSRRPLIFPAMCLVVSGGHTQLILIKKIGQYKILGETRDDAAGECFDKAARILSLGYPGGPAIAKIAGERFSAKFNGEPFSAKLPRPMIKQKNYDFSFSGLKTAILYHHQKQSEKTQKSALYIKAMCAEIQQAIIDVLIYKTAKAARDYGVKTIILGGGVTANMELRKQFRQKFNNLILPEKNFCTDNAAMVAVAAYFNLKTKPAFAKATSGKVEANANLRL